MEKTRLLLVGGFLGAGKTSLLFKASSRFMEEGKRIGLVTNDQAPELVDTALLIHTNLKVAELSGSCFCCDFEGFISSLKGLRAELQADVIIAEPVGSCTDLSATIIQPLKEIMGDDLLIAPLTVLADPFRLEDILDGGTAGLHPNAAYIFEKQLEESDIILITKTDLINAAELEALKKKVNVQYPGTEVLAISSVTGEGIDNWISKVSGSTSSGQRIVELDYDRYAEGEAVLGWLNATLQLSGAKINWDDFAKSFLNILGKKLDLIGAAVGHIKIMLETELDFLIGNLTGKHETLSIRGGVGISNQAQVIINARVGLKPQVLEQLVKETLDDLAGKQIQMQVKAWKCLSPGYPKPTHRYTKVV